MSRYFLILISCFLLLLPSTVHGGEDQKAEIMQLYKGYKISLKEGDREAALKYAEQMYALTPQVFGQNSKPHATATFNLAQMNDLIYQKKVSAGLYQEHVDILDKLKVPNDEQYLNKLGFLSRAYMKIYNVDKAIKYARKELKLARELKLPDERMAEYELRLGSYYYRSYGQGNRARQHINKAYDIYSSIYGKDHFKTAQAIFWQAKLNMGFKKNRKAAEEFEHVLKIYNKELPVGDGRILQTHAFLVNVYEKMGKKDKSTEHCIAVATERPLDFDRDIEPLYKITPSYPPYAQRMGKSGYIVAEFMVDEFGQVKDIKIVETTDKVFNRESIKALSQFRYAPTIRDGERVKTEGVLHKITFQFE